MGSTVKTAPLAVSGDHTSATVTNAVTTLTAPTGATGVYLQAVDANVRFTLDGTDPVAATTGFLLPANDPPLHISLGSNVSIKLTRDSIQSVQLQYQWTRQA